MTRACPDCPAVRSNVLEGLVHREAGCAFRCLSVPARQPLPARWRGDYGFALVRRGIVVRQRTDGSGRATSIDIAGPGSAVPIGGQGDDGAGGYAVDDVMLCLVPTEAFGEAVVGGQGGARDVVSAQSAVLQRVERIAEARSRASATSRVASLLLAIGDTLSPLRPSTVIPSAIQQRDLASLLALRHESVCRSVASLEKSGFVQRSSGGLRIVDRPALEAL
jgi:CRP-like cAMP-binding protein